VQWRGAVRHDPPPNRDAGIGAAVADAQFVVGEVNCDDFNVSGVGRDVVPERSCILTILLRVRDRRRYEAPKSTRSRTATVATAAIATATETRSVRPRVHADANVGAVVPQSDITSFQSCSVRLSQLV
jgi:hypothetical protein